MLFVIVEEQPLGRLSCLTLKYFCRQTSPPDGTNDTQSLNYTAVCLSTSTHQQVLPHPYPSAQFLSRESSASSEDDGKYEGFFFFNIT